MATTTFTPSMLRGAGTRGIPEIPAGSSFTNTYSFDFDGADDFINCGNISGLNGGLTEATWMGWFKRESNGFFYMMGTYGTGQIQFFGMQANGYVTAYAATSAGGQRTMAKANKTWSLNEWYHIAFVYDESESSNADKMKIYIDGILQANAVAGAALTSLHSSTANFNIGRLTGATTNEYNGKIDEVAIFTSAKSASDITTIYNSGTPSNLASFSPLSWWRMGEKATWDGSNWTLVDQGSGGNNGTSNNMIEADREEDTPT